MNLYSMFLFFDKIERIGNGDKLGIFDKFLRI